MVVTPDGAANIPELYRDARKKLEGGEVQQAADELDRIYHLDPDGELAPDSLQLAAIAREQLGDREGALARFEQLARRFPKTALGRDALVRVIRLLCYMERWKRAGEAADLMMSRYQDLRPFESIVALSGKSLALLAEGDLDRASFEVEKGRNVVEAHQLDAAGAVPRDLAQLYYALGEIRRRRAEKITFVPVPQNFAQVLEERCQLLLDAQRAYSDTMRAYDAHWSAMAGYRVGQLYQELHEDLMAMPHPVAADTDARKQLFEGALRLRYSVLLDKALAMMEHTLAMASRTGEHSQWVLKAEEAKHQLEEAQKQENAAIDRLPYTRAELRRALEDLAKKKSAPSGN
ncbi:MAG: hypothetical protein KC776_17035 [Myxococcales bacterium]|nr:hypothetical protein [Myxococcales bacterium]MCB9579760.1 hypothetical protein [Polyangiaceae bacterium]